MMLWTLLFAAANAASPASEEAQGLVDAIANYGDDAAADRAAPWWNRFPDQGLHRVLVDGLAQNPDLMAAEARVRLARAGTWSSLSALLPTVSFEAMTTEAPTDGMGLSPFTAGMTDYGSAFESLGELLGGLVASSGMDPSAVPDFSGGGSSELPDTYRSSSTMVKGAWAIDAFGRSTMTTIAAGKSARAAELSRKATMRTMAGQMAAAWYDLVAAREQVRVIESQVQASADLLELVELRYERGEASAIDVLQQRQQLAQIEALLPSAEAGRINAHGRLSIALGQAPSSPLPESNGFPELPPPPAIGSPSRLVNDRADVAAAVHQLEGARLRRGASISALLPTLTLTGQYGKNYLTMDDTEDVDTWGVGAVATVPLFAGGRTHAGIKAAKAERDIASMQLRASVLGAVQQIEAAIAGDQAAETRLAAVQRQTDAARAALTETRAHYSQGIAPYLFVLTATAADQAAQLAWLDAQRGRMQARIQLHSALGGSWLPPAKDSQ
jgi:outer membrane protein TolC